MREVGLPWFYPERLSIGHTIEIIEPSGRPNEKNLAVFAFEVQAPKKR